ncbi:hypothetical protein OIU76_024124 [Salix suchowensis]|nr:hypothetical protein OIU76_024124 [Salix suchowensis]
MEFAGNNWSSFYSNDCNNLSQNCKMSLIQGFCKVLDGNKLQALLFWVVLASTNEATPKTSSLPFDGCCDATFKNKSNGIALFATSVVVAFDKNSTKHSWIQRVPLIGLEESLQGVDELELNVEVSLYNARKWWVEKCGVHLIMEKSKADSDIHGSSTTDDQRLESRLIRELPKLKIISWRTREIKQLHYHNNSSADNFSLIHDSKTGELPSTPLIVTGQSIGGAVASLFTLWLLDIKQPPQKNQPPPKLPLCVTFGSPFIGNHGLQKAVLDCSNWNSCFLHVVGNKDLFPKASISHNDTAQSVSEDYKAFGSLILCSEKGCASVDDLEEIDYYVGIVNDLKSKVIIRGNSQLDLSFMQPLKAGIIVQLEAIGVEMNTQQQKVDNNNLISKLEEREKVLVEEQAKTIDSIQKLNQIKIKMVQLEWYKKFCRNKEIGYYDCYKNQLWRRDSEVTRLKKFLTNYWKNLVESVERKPQREGAFIRATWLYAGRNYRRMVEPLDIAEYYRENGNRDYQTHGRSRHYILLEQWQEEEDANKLTSSPNNKKKEDVAGVLTEDS